MKNILLVIYIVGSAFLLTGCPTTKETKKEERSTLPAPPKTVGPDITIRIATINVAKLSRRIEKNDIDELGDMLKKGKIDIFTLQGVSRYPGVGTRVDIVDELAVQTEMRQVFGETISLSGKQNGNAILSTYPIRSNENTHYAGLHSNNFDAALQAIIDLGVRDVVVISTGIPERASADDQNTIANKLGAFSILYINDPLIITGNLPASDMLREIEQFESLKTLNSAEAPRMWFTSGGGIKLIDQNTEKTPFGIMTVAMFGVFRQPQQ